MDFEVPRRVSTAPLAIGLYLLCLTSPVAAQAGRGPFAPVTDDPQLPRVLLLGDSISIGYTLPVRGMLKGQANVHRAPTNCGPTSKGLQELDAWLGDRKWDLIHFNFGLHDLKYIDEQGRRVAPQQGRLQIPPEAYRANLERLRERLQQTGAQLIWCTTTPVPPGAHGRIVGDAERYNAIAAEVMVRGGEHGIAVNDLFAFAKPILPRIQRKADVHFTPEGSRQLAMQVVERIRHALSLPGPTPPTARGIVFEDHNNDGTFQESDTPLPNVRVSNGREIVTTNAAGKYELPVSDDTILFVIKPRGYRTPLNENNLPQFFYIHKPYGSPGSQFAGVAPTGVLPAAINFPLTAQPEPNQFKALMFGDPQPRTQQEVDYIAHDVIEEILDTDASFGVTLGDIVFDDLSLFESQARMIALVGIPWYNVIGNHDINYDAHSDVTSDESFEQAFGPAYYAFDYGPVHFLVLDDVEWFIDAGDGKGKYRGGFGDRQLEFIRRDLASIPDDQLVVLMMHIPLTDAHDRQDLYRMIERRPFCMSISAHTHRHEHRMIGKEDGFMAAEPHHHIINVTVSGSWWSGAKDERNIPHTLMADGAPNGYSILKFDGHQYQLDFNAAGRPRDYQVSVFAPEEVRADDPAGAVIYANFFNGSNQSELQLKIGNGSWVAMQKVLEEDPYFVRIHRAEAEILNQFAKAGVPRPPFTPLTSPKPSTHLWKVALPSDLPRGTQLIRVQAKDRYGRVFHARRVLRVR